MYQWTWGESVSNNDMTDLVSFECLNYFSSKIAVIWLGQANKCRLIYANSLSVHVYCKFIWETKEIEGVSIFNELSWGAMGRHLIVAAIRWWVWWLNGLAAQRLGYVRAAGSESAVERWPPSVHNAQLPKQVGYLKKKKKSLKCNPFGGMCM